MESNMSPLVEDSTGNDLTYRIIGAAMTVHNALGPGYKEEVYEKALLLELQQRDIQVQGEYPLSVRHQEQVAALFYLDLFVEGQVVEIKAFDHQLTNDELAQVINYLKAAQAPVGLLFNFGRRRLEYRREFPAKDTGPVQRTGRDNVARKLLRGEESK